MVNTSSIEAIEHSRVLRHLDTIFNNMMLQSAMVYRVNIAGTNVVNINIWYRPLPISPSQCQPHMWKDRYKFTVLEIMELPSYSLSKWTNSENYVDIKNFFFLEKS